MRNKWVQNGVDICDWTVRNHLKEMGFTVKKAKRKLSLYHQWTKGKPHGLMKKLWIMRMTGAFLIKSTNMTTWRKHVHFYCALMKIASLVETEDMKRTTCKSALENYIKGKVDPERIQTVNHKRQRWCNKAQVAFWIFLLFLWFHNIFPSKIMSSAS